ncbi:unnamed protein product [Cuscuta campestris]|uniref:Pectinesterase inhibitor domain-containing protein n=1 Tax=Cuscuta campestris TaxID=132261 RepID=A0A484K5S8_9ASTE|nr:unnamed protein product [Cuscuta campestris]
MMIIFILFVASDPSLLVHSEKIIHPVLRGKKYADNDGKGGDGGGNASLKKICEATEDAKLCVSTISPLLKRRGGAATVQAVLEAGINASYELAKVGSAMAKKLAMGPTGGSGVKDCQGSFDDALYNINQTIEALKSHDVGTMNSMLSAVVSDMSDCDSSLAGNGSPLTKLGDKLANVTSICLGIVSQMEG